MPLPDERPRQSVANLIGRFEKQKSSAGPATPPISFARTSSVNSQRTDDSAMEEAKEKREWPPKSIDNKLQPIPLFEKRVLSATQMPFTSKEKSTELEIPVPKLSVSSLPQDASVQLPPAEAKLPPTNETISANPKPPAPSQSKSTSSRSHTSVNPSAPKTPVKGVTEAQPKPQTSAGSASLTSTPSRSHHPNPTSTPSHTASRTASKPRASVPPKVPATTSTHSKTPVSTPRAKTPSTTPGSGTPMSTVRSKTPTGIFAPTAASLARSKAGAPAPPPPEKPKRKITSDLSKPTAASASRIRTAVPSPKAGSASGAKHVTPKVASKTVASKTSTPAKRTMNVKPRASEIAAVGSSNGEVRKSGTAHEVTEHAAGNGSVQTEVLREPSPEVADVDAPNHDSAVEVELESVDHTTDSHDEIAATEASLEPGASNDEEFENYDEDFPEEPETDVGSASVPEEPITEEPTDDHATKSTDPPDDDSVPGGHHEADGVVREPSQAEPHVAHSKDPFDHEPPRDLEQETSSGKNVDSDLGDIVHHPEPDPQEPRPSLDSSSARGTVSEAGEIPDEF